MRIMIFAALTLLCAGTASAQMQAPPPSRIVSVTCRVGNIGVFQNRVHVRCAAADNQAVQRSIQEMLNSIDRMGVGSAGGGGAPLDPATQAMYQAMAANLPRFFAVGTQAEPAMADRLVQVASAAAAQNRQVEIFFDAANSANPPGCAQNDCRRLIGIVMIVAP